MEINNIKRKVLSFINNFNQEKIGEDLSAVDIKTNVINVNNKNSHNLNFSTDQESNVSIVNYILKEIKLMVANSAKNEINKIKITNNEITEYLKDGSTVINDSFDFSTFKDYLEEKQTVYDFIVKMIYYNIVLKYPRLNQFLDNVGQICSLNLKIDNVYNISIQYFPEETYIYLFYNEFEYYSCQCRKYEISSFVSNEEKQLYNNIQNMSTRYFYANCLNSFYKIIDKIKSSAEKGLFFIIVSSNELCGISVKDDYGNIISIENYVLSRLKTVGFNIKKVSLTMIHFEYEISWTSKDFKISDFINEKDKINK